MRSVAEAVQRRHSGAVEVRLAWRRLVPTGNHVTSDEDDVRDDDLVYYTMSPDYCLPDKTVGSVGTRHRYWFRSYLIYASPLGTLTKPSAQTA